ncbi:hypothetical protein CNR37_00074 [Pseudomonas phage ventosus]|uniref:Uncharacterized protein n=1 Tax=Pseudomonas phage ventosus TaxID=2048980 RepID=A0A2H4P7Z7_9CAUD|nr:hypothetical protein CNR37_00074 [Pseudomonas phage ventosus]
MQQESQASQTGQTSSSVQPSVCSICLVEEPPPWREQPMNEELREYARSYISPPKLYYPSMRAALDVWGQDFNKEDYPE